MDILTNAVVAKLVATKWMNQGQILPKNVCPIFHPGKWINGYFDQPFNKTSIKYPYCVIYPLDKWINGYFDQ